MARLTRAGAQQMELLVARVLPPKLRQEALRAAVEELPVRSVEQLNSSRVVEAGDLLQLAVQHDAAALCKLMTSWQPALAVSQLVMAAELLKEDMVRDVLACGAPSHARDHHDRTALMALARVRQPPCSWAAQERLARVLLDAGCPVGATDASGASALSESIFNRQYRLAALLLDAGAPVAVPAAGFSLLYVLAAAAAEDSDEPWSPQPRDVGEVVAVARKLVAAGADVNERVDRGVTLLMFAAGRGMQLGLQSKQLLALVGALVELGADASAVDDDGKGVIMYLATGPDREVNTGHFRSLVLLLAGAGAQVNAAHPAAGFTALGVLCTAAMLYRRMGPPEPLFRALVDSGADVATPQPLPLLHIALQLSSSLQYHSISSIVRALAAVGCPMDTTFRDLTGVQWWIQNVLQDGQVTYPQFAILQALLDCGCPLVSPPRGYSAPPPADPDSHPHDASWWLADGVRSGSLPVGRVLLRAFPEAARAACHDGLTPLEHAAAKLLAVSRSCTRQQRARPLDPPLAQHVLWFCRISEALLAAGSPPLQDELLQWRDMPKSSKKQISFVSLVASGATWSPGSHAAHPPAFKEAARQLLLINELHGFGGRAAIANSSVLSSRVTRSGRQAQLIASCGMGRRRQAATVGLQLPRDVLHHIIELASQPLLESWVPQLQPALRAAEDEERRFTPALQHVWLD